jgi:Tfp pilus assembly protein PilF
LRENAGDRAGAIQDLDKAIAIAPTADTYARRGLMKQRAGMNKEAQADFRSALALDPRCKAARDHLDRGSGQP